MSEKAEPDPFMEIRGVAGWATKAESDERGYTDAEVFVLAGRVWTILSTEANALCTAEALRMLERRAKRHGIAYGHQAEAVAILARQKEALLELRHRVELGEWDGK